MSKPRPDKDHDFARQREKILASLPRLVQGISGKLGNVVFRTCNRKIYVSRLPKPRSTPPTAAQAAQAEKFRQAATEAKRLLQDPQWRAYYEAMAARQHLPPFAILVGELLRGEPLPDVAAELESMRQAAETRLEGQRERARLIRAAQESRLGQERSRADARARTQEAREAKRNEQAAPSAPPLTPYYPPTVSRPLTVNEILTCVQRLTAAETRFLQDKLAELVASVEGAAGVTAA
jgi:hypothetical protein